MRDCSLGLVGLGFGVRDKVTVSVRNRDSLSGEYLIRICAAIQRSSANYQWPAYLA